MRAGSLSLHAFARLFVVLFAAIPVQAVSNSSAVVMAHELQHAHDYDLLAVGFIQNDCIEWEARAFEAQSRVWQALWTGDLSTGTRIETDLTRVTQRYESEGADGPRAIMSGASRPVQLTAVETGYASIRSAG